MTLVRAVDSTLRRRARTGRCRRVRKAYVASATSTQARPSARGSEPPSSQAGREFRCAATLRLPPMVAAAPDRTAACAAAPAAVMAASVTENRPGDPGRRCASEDWPPGTHYSA